MGAPEPRRSAVDLLDGLDEVAAAEDAAGRVLPRLRRALLQAEHRGTPAAARCRRLGAGCTRATHGESATSLGGGLDPGTNTRSSGRGVGIAPRCGRSRRPSCPVTSSADWALPSR
jgi:hypothetical protein